MGQEADARRACPATCQRVDKIELPTTDEQAASPHAHCGNRSRAARDRRSGARHWENKLESAPTRRGRVSSLAPAIVHLNKGLLSQPILKVLWLLFWP